MQSWKSRHVRRPTELTHRYEARLAQQNVMAGQNPHYPQWLSYYPDFCRAIALCNRWGWRTQEEVQPIVIKRLPSSNDFQQIQEAKMLHGACKLPLSPEDYLAGESFAEVRHEYVDGEVYAMSGARKRHNLISLNLARALHTHLRGTPCQVFTSDVKIHVAWDWHERYYYPDVVVACEADDTDPDVVEKPRLIIEVLSESTERKDRADKFYAYRRLDSLQEYVLVAQEVLRVEVYRRDTNWDLEVYEAAEAQIELRSIGLSLTVAEVYEGLPELLNEQKL